MSGHTIINTLSCTFVSFFRPHDYQDSSTYLSKVPIEIWLKIFENFEPHELTTIACTNRSFKKICQNPSLWEKFLERDFAYYKPMGPKPELDPKRLRCIFFNFMESHHDERVQIQQHNESREANEPLDVETDESFCEKYGQASEIQSNLNYVSQMAPEPLPEHILNSSESNRYYRLYIETLKPLQSLPGVKKMACHPFIRPLVNELMYAYGDTARPEHHCRFQFIRIFKKEDVNTFRAYYRILSICKRTLLKPPSLIEIAKHRIEYTPKWLYAISLVICAIIMSSGFFLIHCADRCIALARRTLPSVIKHSSLTGN